MVPCEQGQQCGELVCVGEGTKKKVSVNLQSERRQQERESLLLGTKMGFDIEVFRKYNPRLEQSSFPTIQCLP